MRIDIDGVTIELMGDPHLGKRFVNGVPLERRGEREAMVLNDFVRSLEAGRDADLHVCMGDLFHAAVVPYEVILEAADIYEGVAHRWPGTTFVVLRGNHDQGRDLEAKTAFDLFARLVVHQYNILVVEGQTWWPMLDPKFLFFGWGRNEWLRPEVEGLQVVPSAVFGHWDVDQRNGEDNLVPTQALAELGITRAFTGHDHKPRRFERDGVEVTVVGSLQPYSFGEEVDDSLYVTITKDQVGDHLKNKVVRIDLAPGEARDVELDCLQLVYRSAEEAKEDSPKVELGDFDLERLAGEVFTELGVEPATAAKTLGLISSTRMRK